jgi:hypothetical protein
MLALSRDAEAERDTVDRSLLLEQLRVLEGVERRIRRQIDACTIRSPIRGTVVAMTCISGPQRAGGGMIAVRDLERLEVRCEVPQNHIGGVQAGLPATFTPDFMDEFQFTGRVLRRGLHGRMNQEGFVFFPVTLSLDGEVGPLIPGMTVSIIIREE